MSIQTKEYKSRKTGKVKKTYHAVVSYKDKNGNSKKHWSRGFASSKEAKIQELLDIKALQEETLVIGKNTFSEVVELWKVSAKDNLAPTTYRVYLSHLRINIIPAFGNEKIVNIKPIHIERFKNILMESYAPITTNKLINLMSGIFEYAIHSLQLIHNNPCRGIKRPKIPRTTQKTWNAEDISYFLGLPEVRTSMYYPMFALSFITGMRPSEICGLSVDSIDGDMLIINRGIDNYKVISNLKTEHSHRTIRLPDYVIALLKEKIDSKEKYRLRYGELYEETDFLFTQRRGDAMIPTQYASIFRKYVSSNNNLFEQKIKGRRYLEPIRMYDARHSFASNSVLIDMVPIEIVAGIMGSDHKTISKHYTHVKEQMKSDVVLNYADKIINNNYFFEES